MKRIPLHSLVLMVGPAGGGKSWIAGHRFGDFEVINAEDVRYELSGDRHRFDINDLVFREIHRRALLKLEIGERAVIDASNLKKRDRLRLVDIGTKAGVPIYFVVCDRALETKINGSEKSWRTNAALDIIKQDQIFLANEHDILRGDHVANVIDMRVDDFVAVSKLPGEQLQQVISSRGFRGLMVIGDVHGMLEPLKSATEWATRMGLFCVFLGDILDYGSQSVACVDHVYDIVTKGRGFMVIGNHERKIDRWVDQSRRNEIKLRLSEGNKVTTRAVEAMPYEMRRKFEIKFKSLLNLSRNHWIVGDTLFTHAAAEPEMFNINNPRLMGKLEGMALFGEIDTENPKREDGYPNRIYDWVDRIPATKRVMVGHDIRSTILPLFVKGAVGGEAYFMDTGSGKGGRLTSADVYFDGPDQKIKNFKYH